MDEPARESERQQHNHGSGTFIGGNNYGGVRYEMLDPKTKATFDKLSKDAPDLAKVLKKAIRDGVISPDVVAALQSAVRNINEDVAESLAYAARNINEDVASELAHVGREISDGANIIDSATADLSATADDLDRIVSSFNQAIRKINNLPVDAGLGPLTNREGDVIDAAKPTARPLIKGIDSWKLRLKIFLCGAGIGIAVGALLAYHLIKH
jgi:hypothetical protein